MKSAPWPRKLPSVTAVLAAAADLRAASAAVSDGADLIDLWDADDATARQFSEAHPDIPVCARTGGATMTRDAAAARRGRALLICPDTDRAAAAQTAAAQTAAAQTAGIAPSGLLVEAPPDQAARLISAGWQVIVRADDLPGPHAAAAVAAIATWLGAAAVATSHVAAARRAVDMTGTIRGTRPIPAGYVRS